MPPKARLHLSHQSIADDGLAGLLPSDDEEEFARPSPELARKHRSEVAAMSPGSQSSRAPAASALHTREGVREAGDDEASDLSSTLDHDVLADYYRLRGIDPTLRTSAKASPAPAPVAPQLEKIPSPTARGHQISRGPDPLNSPLASPHASERSAHTAEFGAGGYSRDQVESRVPPPEPQVSRQSPAPSPQVTASSLERSQAMHDAAKQAHGVQWSWPKWALDSKQPCIEVYVHDDDSGEGRWIKQCTPLHRVVHPDGHDQFLAAQYLWDDEPYEQDFEPQHVRPFWSKQTVLDMARDGTLESIRRP